jgi:hypothetical protein
MEWMRLSFDQAPQTEKALTNKYHVAGSYITAARLSIPGPMVVAGALLFG